MWRFYGLLRLIRPLNVVITVVAVWLGGALTAGGLVWTKPVLIDLLTACASAALIAAGANCINDAFDYEIDVMNRPDRPLPAGQAAPSTARACWAGTTAVGIALAAAVSSAHLLMAAAAAVLLYLYSARLKRLPFAGNLAVAAVAGLALLFGGWAAGSPVPALVGATFAALTTFARELVKDVEDLEGDGLHGARTAPVVYGVRAARTAAAVSLILTVILTPLPFLFMDYGPLFLFLVLVADLMLLRSIWLLPGTPNEAAGASAWLKTAMVAGIAALFAA